MFTGFVTSREWFLPPPVDCLFDDKHHWANCVIEHEELHKIKEHMSGAPVGYSRADSKVNNNSFTERDEQEERLQPTIN